jgi:hypothetical protein
MKLRDASRIDIDFPGSSKTTPEVGVGVITDE